MATKKKRKKSNINFFVKNGKLRKKNMVIISIFFLCLGFAFLKKGQVSQNELENQHIYEQRIKWLNSMVPYAQQMEKKYQILTSISLAQAALESNWNQSELSNKYHNFYGVKANKDQPSVVFSTNEFIDGKWHTVNARFRVYPDWQTSMLGHTLLLVNGTSENKNRYIKVVQANDYVKAAHELYKAGYATDPLYAEKLIKIIELYRLDKFNHK